MDILGTFYNQTIVDASKGLINTSEGKCYIVFNTYVPKEHISYVSNDTERLVPTLIIDNKKEFDELLVKYVNLAFEFYNDKHIPKDIILAMLFVDASIEDFQNPNQFIKRKINYINDKTFEDFYKVQDLGYSNILDGNIIVQAKKEAVYYETPYAMDISLFNPTLLKKDEPCEYLFPLIRYGIDGDTAYIYAIQKSKEVIDRNEYSKKVNRKLFKIGEGFDPNEDNYDNYGEGNLKDVSASFVVSANIMIGLLESKGIKKIVIPALKLIRWNTKDRAYQSKRETARKKNDEKEVERLKEEKEIIEKNLSEKFLRTFLRVAHHYDGLEIFAFPFEQDSALHLHNYGELKGNNSLLQETYELGASYGLDRGENNVSKL